MPDRCCVPNCTGNYDTGPKVSVFSFPKDEELKKKWVQAIKRADYVPTKYSRVCELHFEEKCILRKDVYNNPFNGELIEQPLKIPRLVAGSIPSKVVIPGRSQIDSSLSRDSPESKRRHLENVQLQAAIEESVTTFHEHEKAIGFSNLNEAYEKFSTPKNWVKIRQNKAIILLYLDEEEPNIKIKVVLCENLAIQVYIDNAKVTKVCGKNKKVFILPMIIGNINMLSEILMGSENMLTEGINYKGKIDIVCEMLEDIYSEIPDESGKSKIAFLKEQVAFLKVENVRSLRYSWQTSLFACLLHSVSSHAYRFLRGANKLTLPSPRTIRTICASFSMNPVDEQNDEQFLKYMKNKFKLLGDCDKTLNLMVDEIHLKTNVDYKGGNIVGAAYNSTECATSAHVFMVKSIRSIYTDVAHVLPVHTMSGEDLHKMLKKVIQGLEGIGLIVLSVISDNNKVNTKAMSFFNPENPTLLIQYKHPCDPNRPLFYVIDPVHVMKNIRNNWLKGDQTFEFPDFEDGNVKRVASFDALKEMHRREKDQLVKYGHTLSLKAVYPTSMERQSVRYALQVFNCSTASALQVLGPKANLTCFEDTATFINLICQWWDVVNVKTPLKGKRLRNEYAEPVTKDSHHIFTFLKNFKEWVKNWRQSSNKGLTKETSMALEHSTNALLEIAMYVLNELNFNYVLLGKFQTDDLEDRFSKYRLQAGGQYHVYVRQVFEVESKLRLSNTIPLILKSKTKTVEITREDITNFFKSDDDLVYDQRMCDIPDILKNCEDVTEDDILKIHEIQYAPLVYIAGYSSYAAIKKIGCSYCKSFLISNEDDRNIDYSLISTNSRGGLSFPSGVVVKIASYAYIIAQNLLQNEEIFLSQSNQFNILHNLSFNAIAAQDDIFLGHNNTCHSEEELLKLILKPITNILLKNYVKKKNDRPTTKTMPDVKRFKPIFKK